MSGTNTLVPITMKRLMSVQHRTVESTERAVEAKIALWAMTDGKSGGWIRELERAMTYLSDAEACLDAANTVVTEAILQGVCDAEC